MSVQAHSDGTAIRRALYEQPNCLPLGSVDASVQNVVAQINAAVGR